MRKIASVLAATAMMLAGFVPANAVDAWAPETDPVANSGFVVDWDAGNDLLLVAEEGVERTTFAFARNSLDEYFVCQDPGEANDCGVEDFARLGGLSILKPCEGLVENCIESIAVSSDASSLSPAVITSSAVGWDFPGIPELGVPRGSGPAKFTSSVLHSGGTGDYAAMASIRWNLDRLGEADLEYRPDEFSLRIFAVTERADERGRVPIVEVVDTPDGKGLAPGIGGANGCIYQDVGMCAVEQEFAPGTSFTVTLILSNKVSGWFRGRLQDPVIDVQPIDGMYNRVTISGDSVEVPRFLSQFSLAAGDPDIVGPPNENAHGGNFTIFNAASERAIEIVNGMRERVGDKATAVSRVWSINSIEAGRALSGEGQAYECLNDSSRLLGVVTTNAMTYTGLVPEFDNGFLNYRVAGMHYKPDGQSLNLGTYDMVMRSDVARCLYGYSAAPISATVQVLGEMGQENVATTVVSERDGWLKLAAYGFTFSEKEIQVQIKQSQIRTLTKHVGRTTALTNQQKAQIRATLAKSDGNTKFICTGIRYFDQPLSENILVRKRAKLACDYAKSLRPDLSYWYQTKTTQARSYNGRVLVVSK